MRTPIANALSWPDRIESGVAALNLLQAGQLDFTLADEVRYPCLALAREAWQQGGTSMTTLNAANEIAVENFLKRNIKFTEIAKLITEVMEQTTSRPVDELQVILEADFRARELTRQLVEQRV